MHADSVATRSLVISENCFDNARASRISEETHSILHLLTYAVSPYYLDNCNQSSITTMAPITTPVTSLLKIQHPIMLAGMGQTSGAPLVAAVSNAGGIGVIGGVHYTPQMLREIIADVKANLRDPSLTFGVDLLLPQVGGSARKTNVDYTKGSLNELVDVMIETGAKLFVSAVGVPPKDAVDRLHRAGILYMVSM